MPMPGTQQKAGRSACHDGKEKDAMCMTWKSWVVILCEWRKNIMKWKSAVCFGGNYYALVVVVNCRVCIDVTLLGGTIRSYLSLLNNAFWIWILFFWRYGWINNHGLSTFCVLSPPEFCVPIHTHTHFSHTWGSTKQYTGPRRQNRMCVCSMHCSRSSIFTPCML